MDINMVRDVNNSYVYETNNKKENKESQECASQQYDGRYNPYLCNVPPAQLYQNVQSLKDNQPRKVEPIVRQTKYQNLEVEEQYKKIDTWA